MDTFYFDIHYVYEESPYEEREQHGFVVAEDFIEAMKRIAEYFGNDRKVSVSREISKLHEEAVRGTLEEVIAHFTGTEPRGEIVIVLAGLEE